MSAFGLYDIWNLDDLEKEERSEKNRNWIAIVYPESAPEDWIDRIRDLHLPFAISPLHDKDENETGETKKPHYHIIICFDGPTTRKNANRCIQSLTNGPIVKPCRSIRGSYRYFCHLDNPEKFQYPDSDIQVFNSFEIAMTASDEDAIKKALFYIILVNQIYEYADLMLVLEFEFGLEYSQVARRNHNFISGVVNSIRHSPGATYRRFFRYVTPEAWDQYAISSEFTYENSYDHIQRLIGKENELEKKNYRSVEPEVD